MQFQPNKRKWYILIYLAVFFKHYFTNKHNLFSFHAMRFNGMYFSILTNVSPFFYKYSSYISNSLKVNKFH